MIPWIIGGLLGGLGLFEIYKHTAGKSAGVKAAEAATEQTKKNLEDALARAGIHPASPQGQAVIKDQLKKSLARFTHSAGSAGTTPGPVAPRLITGDPVNTQTGKTYYVTFNFSVPSFLATRDRIVEEAQNHGFTDIIPSPTMPQGWPGKQTGDWYVKARAIRPSQFARQKGVTTIVEGYEQ